jgi:hypothetical protein
MVLIIALVFIAVFSSLGLAIGTMSSRSTRVAVNQHQANRALESAMSGMEIVRYWMDKVSMPGTTAPNMRFSTMKANLANYTGTGLGSAVTLCASEEQAYSAELTSINNDVFRIDVTGTAGQLSRTISVDYSFGVREDTVFDFGVATKGPLQLSGNIQLDGTNIAVEADVYIESENNNNVLSIIGNSQIAGDVSVTNPNGVVTLQGGQAGIGGETGQAAIDNHVEVGVPATDFPHPDTTHFEQYVTGDTIDSSTDIGSITTYNNVRVAANTNPHFSSNVTINGIMFIETPNVVCFSGNCNINGLIVGNGDVNDNSGANQLIFLGNVLNASVSALPNESQYDGLRNETGTFLMAPGFSAGFGGNFGTLGGAIAANGVNFFGNAGGTISGSVINYSPAPMTLSGNSDLFFNRSGITTVPAGFKPEIVLHYDPASYDEIVL